MITKSELKYYNSLLQKKFRKTEKKFLVEGKKTVLEGLKSSYKSEIIFVTQKFVDKEEKNIREVKSFGTRIERLKSVDFKKLSDTRSPEGIAAVFLNEKKKSEFSSLNDPVLIYLEEISDPGNLGTIIRNCDWFGIQNMFLSNESAEIFNPKVIRASMGSVFHLNIFEDISLEEIKELKNSGYEFICGDVEGKSIYEYKKKKRMLLFLANESNGPTQELLSIIDDKITIPGKGKAESLNVASASAVLLAELTK